MNCGNGMTPKMKTPAANTLTMSSVRPQIGRPDPASELARNRRRQEIRVSAARNSEGPTAPSTSVTLAKGLYSEADQLYFGLLTCKMPCTLGH
jgi:hypothetical protein